MAWMYPEHEKRKLAEQQRSIIDPFLNFLHSKGMLGGAFTLDVRERIWREYFKYDDKAFEKEKQEQEKHRLARLRRGG